MPQSSGVYAFKSKEGILYIGKAANLKDRIQNHFKQPSSQDYLFLNQITDIGYIETESSIDALLLESELIKKQKPKYNVMWKDDKQYFYVAITKEQLPWIFLTHQPKEKRITYLGPFVDGKSIKQTLRLLRRAFPYYTTKKHGPKLCAWCHLHLCPGPNPDPKEYKQNIKKLIAVLKGKKVSVLKTIKRQMEQASKEQHFEQAATFRNQFLALENVIRHASIGSNEKTHENAANELQHVLGTTNPIIRIECYDISNIQGKESTGSMVTFVDGKPTKEWYRKFKVHITGKPNDFAMMKEVISRRMKHTEWPYPDLMLIDGGKGQLSSALAALTNPNLIRLSYPQLNEVEFQNLPFKVAALAKQHNELFLPGKSSPLLLKDMPSSARNTLLHIRDEAHRFAITYHRKLFKNQFLDKR